MLGDYFFAAACTLYQSDNGQMSSDYHTNLKSDGKNKNNISHWNVIIANQSDTTEYNGRKMGHTKITKMAQCSLLLPYTSDGISYCTAYTPLHSITF